MADKGYIKLHRKIWDNTIFSSGERFDRRSAWVWLLTHANYDEGSFLNKGRICHVQRGQLVTSIRYLAQLWRWDKTTVSRFLSDMETEKMITQNRTQNGTLITILNYNKYQGSEDYDSQISDTESDTESVSYSDSEQSQNHPQLKKNIKKNIKKSKEKTRGGRIIE